MDLEYEKKYLSVKNMVILKEYREKISSRKIITGTCIAYGIFQFIIILILYPLGLGKVFTLQTTLSTNVVRATLAEWEASGELIRYLCHYYLDFPLPFLYGILLAAIYSKFLDQFNLPSKYNIIIFLPLIIGALDIFENISHLAFIYMDGVIAPLWVGLSGIAACVKWALLFLSVLLCAVSCIKLFIRNKKEK